MSLEARDQQLQAAQGDEPEANCHRCQDNKAFPKAEIKAADVSRIDLWVFVDLPCRELGQVLLRYDPCRERPGHIVHGISHDQACVINTVVKLIDYK